MYDMLNDKHENLVNAVSQASQKAREISQTVQDAEITVREALAEAEPGAEKESASEKEEDTFVPISPPKVEIKQDVLGEAPKSDAESEILKEENQTEGTGGMKEPDNHNEKILRLHKLGKSPKSIAKELGLGVGEVKLVIGLFKQEK